MSSSKNRTEAQKTYEVIFSDDLLNNNVLPSLETKKETKKTSRALNVPSFGADNCLYVQDKPLACGPYSILGYFPPCSLQGHLHTLYARMSILADPLFQSLLASPK